jgi:hypothetical protein
MTYIINSRAGEMPTAPRLLFEVLALVVLVLVVVAWSSISLSFLA